MNVHRNAAAKGTTRRSQPRRRANPVQVTQVPQLAMTVAKLIVKHGSYTRVQARKDGSVIVR